jgi:hypothetical protein
MGECPEQQGNKEHIEQRWSKPPAKHTARRLSWNDG